MLYLLIGHNNLLIFLTETQYNVKGKMMSCFLALMALDIGEIKPLLKKGANLTLALLHPKNTESLAQAKFDEQTLLCNLFSCMLGAF